jgi:hypothetical protein
VSLLLLLLLLQVHSAVLAGSGKEVVIKVLRPGTEDVLLTDLNFVSMPRPEHNCVCSSSSKPWFCALTQAGLAATVDLLAHMSLVAQCACCRCAYALNCVCNEAG